MKTLLLVLAVILTAGLNAQNDSLINGDFETGDFTGWELYQGESNSNPFELINVLSVTPPSSQHFIVAGGNDDIMGQPKVYPYAGDKSILLGDSTGIGNKGAIMTQYFKVDSVKNVIAFHNAIVMQTSTGHAFNELPFYTVRVINQLGDTIYNYEIAPILNANSGGDPNFIFFDMNGTPNSGDEGYYLPWETNYINLSSFVGQNVTIEFTVSDCLQGGHFGYAYIDVEEVEPTPCMFLNVAIDSVQNISCTQPGYVSSRINDGVPPYTYSWSNGDTTSSIAPTNSGIYELSVSDSAGCIVSKSILVNGPDYPTSYDYGVNVTNGVFRPGQLTTLFVDVYNEGCIDSLGQLYFVFDDKTSLNYVSIAPDSIIGDTLIWNISGLNGGANFMPYIGILTDTSANIGDTLCFDIFVTPTINDADTANNYIYYCREVINSYDPNYKEVFPQGVCTPNYVVSNELLTYTVHFQNTGTAPAINIHVMDTLSASLNIQSVKVIGQSHPELITEVINGNTLDFQFNNIHLPSNSSNETSSHGYVVFEVETISNVPHDTRVENKVGIYFDTNDPIITNTVFNTFVDSIPHQQTVLNESSVTSYELNGITYDSSGTYYQNLYSAVGCDSLLILNLTITTTGVASNSGASQISIYPNPINDRLNIKVPSNMKNYQVALYNVTGKLVFEGVNTTSINTTSFAKGVYYIKLQSGDQWSINKVIKE